MKRICLLSDTHGFLDEGIRKHVASCDEVWHAGDIGDAGIADDLQSIRPLRAVYGNIDGAELRRMFSGNLFFEIEGIKVWMTHIGGYPGKYPARIANEIRNKQPDLFICGHSHILKVISDKENSLLHMNPGAAGQHGFHFMRTLLLFSISKGKITDLSAVELGKRGALPTI
jgi:putative phosphoesterase